MRGVALSVAIGADGRIQTGPFGTVLKATQYSSEGVPLISVREIRKGGFIVDDSTPRVDAATTDRLPEFVLRKGDVVFARKGGVERSAFVNDAQVGWFLGSDGIMVRPGRGLDGRFLGFQVRSPRAQAWLKSHATGSTMPSLSGAVLGRLPLWVPVIKEQEAIAEVLGALDDKIAANCELIDTSLQLSQAIHQRVIAEQSTTPTLYTDVAIVGGGATPSTKRAEYWDDGQVPWVAPSDVTALSAPYLADTPRKITEAGLAACSSPLYPAGSILMTSRATIGAFAVNVIPTAVNQGFIVLVPHDETVRWWLFHEMMRRVPEYLNRANGATFLELPKGVFKTMAFDLPSNDVLRDFHSTVDAIHARARAAAQESETLAELRDTLLPALMDGTIRVKDAVAAAEEVL